MDGLCANDRSGVKGQEEGDEAGGVHEQHGWDAAWGVYRGLESSRWQCETPDCMVECRSTWKYVHGWCSLAVDEVGCAKMNRKAGADVQKKHFKAHVLLSLNIRSLAFKNGDLIIKKIMELPCLSLCSLVAFGDHAAAARELAVQLRGHGLHPTEGGGGRPERVVRVAPTAWRCTKRKRVCHCGCNLASKRPAPRTGLLACCRGIVVVVSNWQGSRPSSGSP
eukprot:912811-Pelagomonas_calceolata.AAC.3